jgi:hypothetical protein
MAPLLSKSRFKRKGHLHDTCHYYCLLLAVSIPKPYRMICKLHWKSSTFSGKLPLQSPDRALPPLITISCGPRRVALISDSQGLEARWRFIHAGNQHSNAAGRHSDAANVNLLRPQPDCRSYYAFDPVAWL